EKGNCAQATSNNSLRIIHGGFRYLQNLDIPRVVESCRDQQELLRKYPDFVQPLPSIMPLKAFGLKSRFPIMAAGLFYKSIVRLVCGLPVEVGYKDYSFVEKEIPILKGQAPHGVLYWTDAIMPCPLAFAEALLKEIEDSQAAAKLIENCTVQGVNPCGDFFDVEGFIDKERHVWRSRAVINTLGPWLKGKWRNELFPSSKWCKAFNVILKRSLDDHYAIGFHGDRRLYFVVPRNGVSVLGTEYIPFEGNPDEHEILDAEVMAFIESFNKTFPPAKLSLKDIDDVESGVLPMKRLTSEYPKLFGMEKIKQDEAYVEVLSTKYTTFQSQARKALDRIEACLSSNANE
ncbi:MAG: FAD-dependent oxidoreductase, partial [SAR324 cluster bacterium]|nr:FAD-dependent oxidoreductase [SAR324 cluster bacterium]